MSFSYKDTSGDGGVSFDEFMAPVPEGTTTLTPADGEGPTMKQVFASYDKNRDGIVSGSELLGANVKPLAEQREMTTAEWLRNH